MQDSYPNNGRKWIKSSFCSSSTCVEVSIAEDSVAVRDSKDLGKSALVYTKAEWQQFLAGVENGEFDF
ncbi:DUF397 domain-containing protein [Actinoplanes sp. CA-054009]